MSATFSADNGATALELQQKHNWKNPSMALEYVTNSRPHREKMAAKIQGTAGPSTSSEVTESPETSALSEPTDNQPQPQEVQPPAKRMKSELPEDATAAIGTMFKEFTNCTFNITIQK